MVAGHVRPANALWATDARGFLALGVPPGQVVEVGLRPRHLRYG